MVPSTHTAGHGPAPVSLGRRLLALIYDALLAFAVLFLAAAVVVVPTAVEPGSAAYPVFLAYLYTVLFFYLGWHWIHRGATLGMRTWGLRLVADDGRPPTWGAAMKRYLAAWAAFAPAGMAVHRMLHGDLLWGLLLWIPLLADYAMALVDPAGRAWHDRISGTRLVRTP
ncbi:MAG TPA: RDD family protein [Chromatiales bacterium]|nr:RDD family protein [Chromatiales bacterium]